MVALGFVAAMLLLHAPLDAIAAAAAAAAATAVAVCGTDGRAEGSLGMTPIAAAARMAFE